MSRAARSVYVFGIYLVLTGAVLMAFPNVLLGLLRLPSTNEPWIHVLGVPVMAMGLIHVMTARAEDAPFFRASVRVRVFALLSFVLLAALRIVPPIIILFGVVDAASALWTHRALRGGSVLAVPANLG